MSEDGHSTGGKVRYTIHPTALCKGWIVMVRLPLISTGPESQHWGVKPIIFSWLSSKNQSWRCWSWIWNKTVNFRPWQWKGIIKVMKKMEAKKWIYQNQNLTILRLYVRHSPAGIASSLSPFTWSLLSITSQRTKVTILHTSRWVLMFS